MQDAALHSTVAAAQAGDHAAFARLYAEFGPLVRRMAGDEDASQRAWLAAIRRINTIHDAARIGNWLRTIAFNMRRSAKLRTKPLMPLECEVTCKSESPLDAAIAAERAVIVGIALTHLAPSDRQVIETRYFGCDRSRMTPAVKSRLRRAKEKIAGHLRRAM